MHFSLAKNRNGSYRMVKYNRKIIFPILRKIFMKTVSNVWTRPQIRYWNTHLSWFGERFIKTICTKQLRLKKSTFKTFFLYTSLLRALAHFAFLCLQTENPFWLPYTLLKETLCIENTHKKLPTIPLLITSFPLTLWDLILQSNLRSI